MIIEKVKILEDLDAIVKNIHLDPMKEQDFVYAYMVLKRVIELLISKINEIINAVEELKNER